MFLTRFLRGKPWFGCHGRVLGLFTAGAGLAVALAGCTSELGTPVGGVAACAQRRLDAAVISYEDAKTQFSEHFKGRSDTALAFAYHASEDSVRLARSLGDCFDFNASQRIRAIELIRSNYILKDLLVSNMRDQDPGAAIGLFGNEYRDFIPKDIN